MIQLNKNSILIGVVVLLVVVAAVFISLNSSPGNIVSFLQFNAKSKESIAKEAIDYLNKSVLQDGQTATLNSVSEESGVIKINIKINGTDYDSYVTKDGKLLFPEALKIVSNQDSNEEENNNSSPTAFNITEENHVRGDFSSQITLVEFSDFECPFCKSHIPTLERILNEYSGFVRLVYKHFPLSNIHPNAQKAAEASECASEQGKFWEFHDKLFAVPSGGLSVEKYKQIAKELSLDTNKFNDCLDGSKYEEKVRSDYNEGSSHGVTGTPANFINGELISGAVPYDDFKKKIDELLQK